MKSWTFINEGTKFDLETGERGIFVGESLARTVLDRIRQSSLSQISGLTTYTGASQIGFETQPADGTIKLNEATLDAALSRKLFSGSGFIYSESHNRNRMGLLNS